MKKREQIITPEFRMVYPNLFKPTSFEDQGKATYNVVAVFPKGADLSAVEDAIRRIAVARFPGVKGLRNPVRDGNEKVEDWGELFKDAKYIRFSTQFRPRVVDAEKREIMDEAQAYSGCYARAVISPYTYDNKGNRGISFGLDAIQITRDGEPIGGGSAAVSLFDEVPGAGDIFGDKAAPATEDIFG